MKDGDPRDDAARAARAALKGAGLAATRVRVACLALAMRAGAPITRAELARALPGRKLDRVTLYRTLRRFEEVGLFRRERTPGGEETWCLDACEHGLRRCPGHMHFECRSCGRVECVKTAPSRVRRALGPLFSGEGLPVEGARIEAWGLCRRCTGPGTSVPGARPARGAGRVPGKRRRA
ncbi:MAG: Fur family transcriptional regulator [Planctomycetota bacterium]|jgi:Fur family ferric uptake transcriptional regulator